MARYSGQVLGMYITVPTPLHDLYKYRPYNFSPTFQRDVKRSIIVLTSMKASVQQYSNLKSEKCHTVRYQKEQDVAQRTSEPQTLRALSSTWSLRQSRISPPPGLCGLRRLIKRSAGPCSPSCKQQEEFFGNFRENGRVNVFLCFAKETCKGTVQVSVADPGCLGRIPDLNFSIPDPSQKDPRSRYAYKNLSIFNPKTVSMLQEK